MDLSSCALSLKENLPVFESQFSPEFVAQVTLPDLVFFLCDICEEAGTLVGSPYTFSTQH